jgi:hypothetical protein
MTEVQELQLLLGMKVHEIGRLHGMQNQFKTWLDKLREAVKDEPEVKEAKPEELLVDAVIKVIDRLRKEKKAE